MNRPILGLPFFERNNITIHPKTRTLSLPDMTLQLNEISSPTGNIKKTYSKFYLKTTEKLVIRPNCQDRKQVLSENNRKTRYSSKLSGGVLLSINL